MSCEYSSFEMCCCVATLIQLVRLLVMVFVCVRVQFSYNHLPLNTFHPIKMSVCWEGVVGVISTI